MHRRQRRSAWNRRCRRLEHYSGGGGGGGYYGGGGGSGACSYGGGGGGGGASLVPAEAAWRSASPNTQPQVQISYTGAQATTQTFTYSGAEQTFTVPRVSSACTSLPSAEAGSAGGAGGAAAQVGGDLSVTPGETLYVEVGGSGGNEQRWRFQRRRQRCRRWWGRLGRAHVAASVRLLARREASRGWRWGGGGATGGATGGKGRAAGEAGRESSAGNGGGGAGTQSGGGSGSNDAPSCTHGSAGQLGTGGVGGLNNYSGGGGGGGYYGGGGGSGACSYGGGGGGGGASLVPAGGSVVLASPNTQPQVQISYTGALPAVPHVMVIMEENRNRSEVIGNSELPYFNSLASTYGNTTNWDGVRHPSLPNYLAIASGSTQGVTRDEGPEFPGVPTVGSQLTEAGIPWKGYMEAMPEPGYTGVESGEYVKKHNPFAWFPKTNGSKVVPGSQFATDLGAGRCRTSSGTRRTSSTTATTGRTRPSTRTLKVSSSRC